MILTRRSFFGLLAAPAIIRIADLMPIKALPLRAPLLSAAWSIPMSGEDLVNYAPKIEAYQQAIARMIDIHAALKVDGQAELLKGYRPGGDPAGWTPHRTFLTRGERALMAEIGPECFDEDDDDFDDDEDGDEA